MKPSFEYLLWRLHNGLLNLKRRLLNWRGDGVHSPYAFNLIRQTIRCPHPYQAYRDLYDKVDIPYYKKELGDDCLWERSILELVFRLCLSYKPKSYMVYRASGGENLPLLQYLQATGYREQGKSFEEIDFLIIEEMQTAYLPPLHIQPKPEGYMLIINTKTKRLRNWTKEARLALNPPISFSMINLEIWVWRPATSPGHYPVYYK